MNVNDDRRRGRALDRDGLRDDRRVRDPRGLLERRRQTADVGVLLALQRVEVRDRSAIVAIDLGRVADDTGARVGDVRDVGLVMPREDAADDDDADRGERDRTAKAGGGGGGSDHACMSTRPGRGVNRRLLAADLAEQIKTSSVS